MSSENVTEANRLKPGYSPNAAIIGRRARDKEGLEQLGAEFERNICKHFESVEIGRFSFPPPVETVLLLRKDSIRLSLYRSRAAWVDWQLVVRAGMPFLLRWSGGRGMNPERADLRKACREIHEVLTGMSSVSRVYWYARQDSNRWNRKRAARSATAGVWTPDELPWGES